MTEKETDIAPTGEKAPANPLTDADKKKAADLATKVKNDIKESVIDSLDSLKPKEPVVDAKAPVDAKAIEDKVRAEIRAELIAKEKEAMAKTEREAADRAVVDLKAQVEKLQEKINDSSVGGRQPVNSPNPLDKKPDEKFEDYDDKRIEEISRNSEIAMWEQRSRGGR